MIAEIETSGSGLELAADSEGSGAIRRRHYDADRRRIVRVVIPLDPEEYERRRLHAQRIVDEHYGRGRYCVVGRPGEMLQVIQADQRRAAAFG